MMTKLLNIIPDDQDGGKMTAFIKIIVCAGIIICMWTGVSPAGFSRVLSDYELDQIFAGGLNLDFDNVLGSFPAVDALSKGGTADLPAAFQHPDSGASNSAVDIVELRVLKPSGLGLASAENQPGSAFIPGSPENSADIPQSVPDAGAPGQVSNPSPHAAAGVPDSVRSLSPVRVFDVIAGNHPNGKFSVGVNHNSAGGENGAPVFTVSNSGTQNFLNVTETAQQNLQALVNVNAAGSIVPIQLNLTILINSSVQNLNNSNMLDLNNFSTFQF